MKNILFLLFLIPTVVLAQLELPYSIKILNPRPVDAYYFNSSGTPYTNTAQVISQIVAAVRYRGLTVNVNGTEYWFAAGTADGDLVVKENTGITNSGTANEVVKSDGTNIVGTGLFTSSDGLWTRTGNFNLTTTGDVTFTTANGVGLQSNNATNNTVYNTATIQHSTTGTPATGIGSAIRYVVETSNNNNETGALIEAVTTDATAGSEDFDLRLSTMAAGASAAPRVWINNTGLGVGATPGVTIDAQTSGVTSIRSLTSGSGEVNFTLQRTGGTTASWGMYLASGSSSLRFFDGVGDRVLFNTTGSIQINAPSGGESNLTLNRSTGTTSAWAAYLPSGSTDLRFLSTTDKFIFRQNGQLVLPVAPTNDDTETSVLVRQSDGEVQTRAASSLAASPAGSNGQVQFNNSGSFGASANLTFLSDVLSVNGKSLIGPSIYSFTNEIFQVSKNHSSYASIEDAITVHVSGANSASISDGFGGQMKIGLSSTAGTIGRTGIFSHSWVNVGSNLSKVRYGQVVGANLQSGVDFFSDGTTTFINGSGNSVLGLSTTGIKPDNYGVKHGRAATGSIAASSSTNVNITWSSAFPDTDYTLIVSVVCSTPSALLVYPTSKTATDCDITVTNSSLGSLSGEVNVIAIHD